MTFILTDAVSPKRPMNVVRDDDQIGAAIVEYFWAVTIFLSVIGSDK
jgi:hypothetical protein